METPVGIGEVLAGKYRVERVLGTGGMGVVVAAWHLELDQRVALKFLHRLTSERSDAAERFRREARALAKIRSEHVCRVFDVSTLDNGVRYMVMEFLQGHDLGEELRARGRFGIVEAIDCILPAIEAIAEAHAIGIVHRDLKPANLFLAKRADGSSLIKVLDFGVSKSLLSSSPGDVAIAEVGITQAATLIGSPLYMPPEQMRSARDVDQRADIWALGAILYELLVGVPPYTGETISELVSAVHNDEPLPLARYRNDVPPGLEAIILRCLAKDRSQRWPTVANLATALGPYGSPGSMIHVLRACRVLKSAAVDTGSARTENGTRPLSATMKESSSAGSNFGAANQRETNNLGGGTQSSWAHTASKRRTPQLVAALALTMLAAVGTVVFMRSRASEEPQPDKAAEIGPSVVPAHPLPNEPPRDPKLPSPAAEAAAVASVKPTASEPAPAMTPAARFARPRSVPRVAPTPAVSSSAKPSTTPPRQDASQPNSVTDFGGRR